MSSDEPVDELLVALDHFTNAVYWLQARTGYTAAQALAEALTDWTAGRDEPTEEAELRDSLSGFIAAASDVPPAHTLADALNAWSSAVSAEHHHSAPFQAPRA